MFNENIFTDLYSSLQVNDVDTYEKTIDITSKNAYQYSPYIENLYEVDNEDVEYYVFYEYAGNYIEIPKEDLFQEVDFNEGDDFEEGVDYYEKDNTTTPASFIKTEDETPDLSKDYYVLQFNANVVYYEKIGESTYVKTTDLIPNIETDYYKEEIEPVPEADLHNSNPVQEGWYETDDQEVYYESKKCYAYKPKNANKCTTTTPFEKVDNINKVAYYYYKFANTDETYRLKTDNDKHVTIAASGNNIQDRLYSACYSIVSSSVTNHIKPTKVDTLWNTRWSERYPSSFKYLDFARSDEGSFYFVSLTDIQNVADKSKLGNNSYTYYTGFIYEGNGNDSEKVNGFFINNTALFEIIMNRSVTNNDKYMISNSFVEGGIPNPDLSYKQIDDDILTTWYAGVSTVGKNNINCFPLFIIPIYYKLKYLVSVVDNYYYRLKTFAKSSFGTIDPWSCDSLASDYIIDNPAVNLIDLWQPVQNNCSITITENDMITLSEGDTISIIPDNSSAEYIKYPVFYNTETILNLDNYTVNYITSNSTLNTLEKIDIPGLDWRAYSSLLLNTSDISGQVVQPNHSITFMDQEGNVVYNIPDDINIDTSILNNQQIKFQLKNPVNNRTGSNIQVFTFDDLSNEIPNAVYIFYNVYDTDEVTYSANGETVLKFNLNNIEINDDISGTPRYISLPLGLPVGDYLLPLNAKSGVDVRAEMTDYVDVPSYTAATISGAFETDVTYYEKGEDNIYRITTDTTPQVNKTYYIVTSTDREKINLQLTSFTDIDHYEFTGDNTYYLYMPIRDIDDEGIHELKFYCDDTVDIVLSDIFKFSPNAELSNNNVYDDVFNKVKSLDTADVYNYTFQPNANDLISNPLLPIEFWNKNHVFNKNTIAQLDLSSADNLTYRFITSR